MAVEPYQDRFFSPVPPRPLDQPKVGISLISPMGGTGPVSASPGELKGSEMHCYTITAVFSALVLEGRKIAFPTTAVLPPLTTTDHTTVLTDGCDWVKRGLRRGLHQSEAEM